MEWTRAAHKMAGVGDRTKTYGHNLTYEHTGKSEMKL